MGRTAVRVAWHVAVAVAGSAAAGYAGVRAVAAAVPELAVGLLLLSAAVCAAALAVTWAAVGRLWGLVLPAYHLGIEDVLSPGMDANYGFIHAVHRGDADRIAGHLDRLSRPGPSVDPTTDEDGRLRGLRARARRRQVAGVAAGLAVAAVGVLGAVGLGPVAGWLGGDVAGRATTVAVALAGQAAVLVVAEGQVIGMWVRWYQGGEV